uniref:Integrase catalytic domain-containing protein n=2 Tax=Meloidogyne enterolobii TaxID=390850 RepID=A0A6V7XSU6_MELEN|nr:unnamed protein product [Meloidogyne enterolobii]
MAAIYIERIQTARDVIEMYLDTEIPVIPQAINTPREKHILECKESMLKENHDELLTQTEEIRSCRARFSELCQASGTVVRAELDAAYREHITPHELQAFLTRANTKIKAIRDARTAIKLLLEGYRGNGNRRNVVLPALTLKEFDGTKWDQFWPLYETTIHVDTSLDPVQKMTYLDSLIIGEARKVIQGLVPFSDDNYLLAIDLLKEKYGKKENQIRDLHNKLSKLPNARQIEDDQKLQLDIERLSRQLENLDQDLSSPQVYLNLEQKMSKKVLQRYIDLKMADPNKNEWSTGLFRKTYQKAIEQLNIVNEIYLRSENKSEGKRYRESSETRDSTMNLAVRYKSEKSDRKARNDIRGYQNQDRNQSTSRSSSQSSYRNAHRNPHQTRGSPWPNETNNKFNRDSSSSRSRSPNRFKAYQSDGNRYNPRDNYSSRRYNYRSQSSSRSRSPSKFPCFFCNILGHFALDCRKFPTIKERENLCIKKELCVICLKSGHSLTKCPQLDKKCFLCNRRMHHPAICPKRKSYEQSTSTIEHKSDNENIENSVSLKSCQKQPQEIQSLLKCAKIQIYNPLTPKLNKEIIAFLDDGSEKSYISKNLIKELDLPEIDNINFDLKGLGGSDLGCYQASIVELGIKSDDINMLIKARELNKVMPKLPRVPFREKDLEKLISNKILVTPRLEEPQLLIGGDFYNHLDIKPMEQLANGFWISSSKIGTIISGEGKISKQDSKKEKAIVSATFEQTIEFEKPEHSLKNFEEKELNELVNRHNQLETIGLGDTNVDENEKWLKEFEENLTFNGDRYEVKLIWNEEVNNLTDNYYLALGRLKSTRKKLLEKGLIQSYNEIMQDQFNKGIIEKAPREKGAVTHYLPHHYVERADKQFTKIRIVFDASAKLRKELPSLNQCLNKGPKLYNDLTGILLRARLKKYIITCDIEKAFLQIGINQNDRDALRFLWYSDPNNEQSSIIEYRFCRVTFGVICSPTHLSIVLKHHYKKYNSQLVKELEVDKYVDNLLLGIENPEEIFSTYLRLKKIFKEANMNVREFTSNAWKQCSEIPECDKLQENKTKLLGLNWDINKDNISIKLKEYPKEKTVTRRNVLSAIAQPFDPLGLISPIILQGKLLRQKLEENKKLKWDTQAENNFIIEWKELMQKWDSQEIVIPRHFSSKMSQSKLNFELHGFSDASAIGIGCAIYLRITDGKTIKTQLAFAKSLVVPSALNKAKRTIPCLELHATKICCTNVKFVKSELEKSINISDIKIWTDSADVIDFLNSNKEKDRFIKNRVKEIRKYFVAHIDGKSNPADLASRGCTPEQLNSNRNWFEGPEWLAKSKDKWPKSIKEFDPMSFVLVESNQPALEMSMTTIEAIQPLIDYSRFSQYKRLKNATAYFLRAVKLFLENIKNSKKKKKKGIKSKIEDIASPTATEVKLAEKFLIKEIQKSNPPSAHISKNLELIKIEDIWRVKGRIENSELEAEIIHPIYLPRNNRVTELMIVDLHKERKHAGPENLSAAIRQKFWVPGIRQKIISVIKKNPTTRCHWCARHFAKAYQYPKAPPLPGCRVKGEEIWENVGIDNFGPMVVKIGKSENKQKVWGTIFVCALSRNIHLELVTDASAEKFLLAFTRFVRRWRTPRRIISDNGTNFVLGSKAIKKLQKENAEENILWNKVYQDPEVQNNSNKNEIEWIFITPFAPWKGGMYERMIGTVKYHLKREIRNKLLTLEELWTLLIEVERIVNERPLSYMSESEAIKPLRPIDLAFPTMNNSNLDISPKPIDTEDPDFYIDKSSRQDLVNSYAKSQNIIHNFWEKWRETYLMELRDKHYSSQHNVNTKFPQPGDVVIISDINTPRSRWKLARVEELVSTRTAKVRVGNKIMERATKHLFPLEI